ncbi:hypothetical protein OVN20_03965 [Microcella daejeonensis]|uniref:hypothetical protein n=1 Tax=Microcella daejeonensis TaxID=2994971 RepID=UPI002271C8BC|nr:hypothetical protein [Microcella daejeonensis]WAB84731.1 hypothetical protein OVN20_03965 [Microcella daejeonensis]
MATALGREEIAVALRELAAELRAAGEIAGIRLVGGAALALRYFDRGTTQDLDVLHARPGNDAAVLAAASRVAARRDWSPDWLSFAVTTADALPTMGRAVEWHTVYDDGEGIVMQVACKEALLAMKLRANRPGRDTRDIRLLLALCAIHDRHDAEVLYEDFYPGDALSDRALSIVDAIFADGALEPPPALPPIVI